MKDFLISSNHALTAYDKQQYKDQIDKLETELYELKDKVQPRKKFAFSKKKAENQQKSETHEKKLEILEKNAENQKENTKPMDFMSQVEGIDGEKNKNFTLGPNQVKNSWKVVNNKNCEIRLNALFDCVFVKNNRNCKISIGPVKSSVFLDNNEDCEISVLSHQVYFCCYFRNFF